MIPRIFLFLVVFLALVVQPVPADLVVDFAANVTDGTAPLLVEFSNLVEGTQVNCTWGIGTELVSGCAGPVYNFIVPGLYDINLTVTDDTNLTVTETKIDYINVTPANIPVSFSFVSNTIFGSNPVEITDANGTIVFVGNTSSRNISVMEGSYKIQIEPGGITDGLNSPDYGLAMGADVGRKNIIGILVGASMLLVVIGYLVGKKS